MIKHSKLAVVIVVTSLTLVTFFNNKSEASEVSNQTSVPTANVAIQDQNKVSYADFPMSIEALRKKEYPGSQFVIEEVLADGINYQQFITSYTSDGLKIYGLLTVPKGARPEKGFPAIMFVHGYIPPTQYVTTKNYVAFQAVLAKNGFVTFKPDLRGHGESEGKPVEAHFSEKYVVDTLNAISSLQLHESVDPSRIGYWGHSNGGEIGLRSMVISPEIKAGVLWAGVVGSYKDTLETYNAKIPFLKNTKNPLVLEHGLPSANPEFWNAIDPYSYLHDFSGPVQIHHGSGDAIVPVELSIRLVEELQKVGADVEYHEYQGDNHNITNNFGMAWQNTVNFFKVQL